MSSTSVFAQETDSITVLGDSISTGYGLDDSELSYCGYLQQYFDADLENFAVNGQQTTQLLDLLENDTEVIDSVKNSDLVCVTIGGNDVLHIFEEAAFEFSSGGNMSGESQFSFSQDFVQSFIMQYASAFGPAAAQAGENISEIREKILELNPDASVVMQTIYNPFEASNESMNNIMKPLKTFTALYLGVINNAVKQQPTVIADIHKKLETDSWMYTNISEFDIHPNFLGHMLIAEEIIQKLRLPGNGEIFRSETEKIPDDIYSAIPQNLIAEIDSLAKGEFRTEDLQSADGNVYSAENETQTAETTPKTTQSETEKTTEKTTDTTKQDNAIRLSSILLMAGILLITFSVCRIIFVKKRRQNK